MSKLVSYQPQTPATNWDKASVNSYVSGQSDIPANVYTTFLNVTGKGYLRKFLLAMSSYNKKIRITIDGVVVLTLNSTGTAPANAATGVCFSEDFFALDSLAPRIMVAPDNHANVPSNVPYKLTSFPDVSETKSLAVLTQPVVFEKSLLIEVYSITGAEITNYCYEYLVL